MPLDVTTVRNALALLGDRIGVAAQVEIVITGGGAALLTGTLPPASVTADIDVIHFRPASENDQILRLAGEVGRELSFPPDWLNEHARLYFHELPTGWEHRKLLIGQFGGLTVFAVGRTDFIAMKFYAHRAGDLEHLKRLRPSVTGEELSFVLRHLEQLAKSGLGNSHQIEMSRIIVQNWTVRE